MFGERRFRALDGHAEPIADLWDADTILSGVVIPTSWTRLIYDDNPYHILGMMNYPAIFRRFDYVDDVAVRPGVRWSIPKTRTNETNPRTLRIASAGY